MSHSIVPGQERVEVRRQRRMAVATLTTAYLTLSSAQRALMDLHDLVATDEDGTEWAGVLGDIVAEMLPDLDDVRRNINLADPSDSDDQEGRDA